jgi:hypothetical protein
VATYRYLFADALTGQLIEELPLDCQSYSQIISGPGQCVGTLAVADPAMPVLWRQATEVKRTLLMIQRGDDGAHPLWGGVIMKRRPVGTGHVQAEITAETLEGYWQRRRVKTDLDQVGVDLFDIVRAIIDQLQGVTGGNLRMLVSSGLHGSTTTISYLGKDHTKALDAINRLAEESSFEYTITWNRSGQIFTPTLVLAAPALGLDLTPILLEFPGSLAAPVEEPEDGGEAPNALTGIGADDGGIPLSSEAIDTDGELADGYPIYEDETQLKDEGDQDRLDARTLTALRAKLGDSAVPTVQLRPPEHVTDLTVGDVALGLPTRLRCTCPYHPPHTDGSPSYDDSSRRITGWTVTPGAAEQTTLALGSVTGLITPPLRDRSIAAYLADLDRRVRELATRT